MFEKWKRGRARMRWMRGLKPGDVVCDCRYKHVKIKEALPQKFASRWFHRLTRWLPLKAYYFAQDAAKFLHLMSVQDQDLTLEDGAHCSALSCCDPIEDGHTEESHAETIAEIDREQEELESEYQAKKEESPS